MTNQPPRWVFDLPPIPLPSAPRDILFTLAIGAVVLALVLWGIQTLPARIRRIPRPLHENSNLNALKWFAFCMAPFWAALVLLTLWGTFGLWFTPPAYADALAYRVHFLAIVGLTTVLAGLVGTPLALIRVFTTERQTKTAEQGHITDRIAKAVDQLGAEKTVRYHRRNAQGTKLYEDGPKGKPDLKHPIYTDETRPNIEVRIGGIYALERIAKDSDSDHVQIMEILCAYIRENAPASGAETPPEFSIRDKDRNSTNSGKPPKQKPVYPEPRSLHNPVQLNPLRRKHIPHARHPPDPRKSASL